MDTNYSQEQEAFRDSLRRFLADKAGLDYTRARWNETIAHTPEVWSSLVDLGVSGLLVPEEHGGLGGNMTDIGVVMEELGRSCHPAPVWSSVVGGTSAAQVFGLNQLLSDLAQGTVTATLAIEEKGESLLNWKSPKLHGYNGTLTGKKIFVPDALSADYIFVTADEGVYLLEKGAAGLNLEAIETVDGSRRFAHLSCDKTPAKRVGSNVQLAPVIDRMLIALCTDALGAAERALELAVEYAKERVQFGKPIGSFQAVQHLCADMLQFVEMGRAGCHHALWAADAAEPEVAHRAAVMLKAFMSEHLSTVAKHAIQIFAGAGYTWEYDIHFYYKRLLSMELTWGDDSIWLEELARIVIDKAA